MGRLFQGDAVAVLRVRSFQLYASSRMCSAIALALSQAVIAWQVYAISGSTFQLGLIGLVRFFPLFAMSLVGGAMVDTYDRRAVLFLSQIAPLVAIGVVLVATATDHASLLLLYGAVLVMGLSAAFENPARQAILAGVVPRDQFSAAITLNASLTSVSNITGPSIGGIAIAWQGVSFAYGIYEVLLVLAVVALIPLRVAPIGEQGLSPQKTGGQRSGDIVRARPGVRLEAIREGIAYVWHRPVLLGAMTLDLFAVIFGGAKAMLPVYAVDVLHVGPTGFGILAASLDAGALVTSVILIMVPRPSNFGRAMLLSVTAFGVATIAFGLSTSLPLSVAIYAAVGMADQISVVMRQTAVQLNTPDELRGRVTAVNQVFVTSSNQLGLVESGFVAAATNAVFAVVSGGVACLVVVGLVAWRIPEMRSYRMTGRVPDPGEA